ncbi:hypothetical protein L1887_14447 [Cichorium endivia]|nr:hypothetical protein L1887_14447 [Cichorium endivia]
MNGSRISAVIFNLDDTLHSGLPAARKIHSLFEFCFSWFQEQVTKDLLKEFFVRYGKVVDMEKENKRVGMIHHESAIAIVKDYHLPITTEQYSQSIMPMYHEK